MALITTLALFLLAIVCSASNHLSSGVIAFPNRIGVPITRRILEKIESVAMDLECENAMVEDVTKMKDRNQLSEMSYLKLNCEQGSIDIEELKQALRAIYLTANDDEQDKSWKPKLDGESNLLFFIQMSSS